MPDPEQSAYVPGSGTPLFPVFLRLAERPVLVVGAGEVAARKARALRDAGAMVTVVAPQACASLASAAAAGEIRWVRACFEDVATQLVEERFRLAIAATDEHRVNTLVYTWCRQYGILCNVVDAPDLCDFFVPARLHRRDIQIAVSTSGMVPGLAAFLRDRLADLLPPESTLRLLSAAYAARQRIRRQKTDPGEKARRLREEISRLWQEEFGSMEPPRKLSGGNGRARQGRQHTDS